MQDILGCVILKMWLQKEKRLDFCVHKSYTTIVATKER
uniref:Uncharacterized protein n=1 Tax=Myoviridae sp. ctCop38 TaxID=2826632 RepID=A0A8S5MZB3_9CAUD|nr:MAG TPA: hypothetical protein [Myoviridae sp. ctCop38]